MGSIYQFNNGNNWQLISDHELAAVPVPNHPDRHYPIGLYEFPLILHNPNIAIYCNGPGTPRDTRYWADVRYRINTNIIAGNTGEARPGFQNKAWIGEVTIFTFPQWATDYLISIKVPFWYLQFFVAIYEYTGPVLSSEDEKLDTLIRRLL